MSALVKAILSTRPLEDFERELCLKAANKLLTRTPLDERIATTIERVFLPESELWLAARETHVAADAVAVTARRDAGTATELFVAAARCWVGSIRDTKGKIPFKEVGWLLGGLQLSRFVELPHPELVSETKDVLVRLPRARHLAGDPAAFSAFKSAYEILSGIVEEEKTADKAEDEAKLAVTRASRDFDLAWGIVVRVVRKVEGKEQMLTLLPVFHRARGAKDESEDVIEVEEPAPEPAPAPPVVLQPTPVPPIALEPKPAPVSIPPIAVTDPPTDTS